MARTILITGCSDGGLGAALATAFQQRGDRVFATARNPAKMPSLKAAGMETLALDVLSDDSIKACVAQVSSLTGGSLDMLINNAGAGYSMPLMDADIEEIDKLFRLNILAVIRTTQLFLPLLRAAEHGAMVVNQTSVVTVLNMPWQASYGASKAGLASITATLRLELEPFNIKVVDLRTGAVKSMLFENMRKRYETELPKDSIYKPIEGKISEVIAGDFSMELMEPNTWATRVVGDLSKQSPPLQIWRGVSATQAWLASFFPAWLFQTAWSRR
ncbi:NADPH-dependent 1-acyl dihydroxyacetone phosphate reductase [Elasticomyces elasticus]|uniref:NADPH-dependent 1-acyl dihydroxyacetone phosphate reductase n=1 Tax=Exophiala sideris TaxID=1016849 RepID=A0ABR0JCZ1_9EURO|nr:NADPH-dependent 1-acyl dihydroxyacetone phosphate reductase [Elasticomyces elasticus]KAK5031354.1 NADPH-dependent 1-acyl dihydroxyacetone phosphate reductase [Exophiala sideris]KAK5039074.1 NADPH-dependent 1-acyl dihydroxyacetone phosphate reductase [Exophiala sideris]KAK5060959.1 NADPH-dependent 1-acyl dihydroxyacetone phosphate reductase [Exophiala sideris]KAK5183870.1 NADPH-dependent 1-acyl dihydroxyacetone phosphate reductase [Eurotiomycetes sp. CCFEE 6388]